MCNLDANLMPIDAMRKLFDVRQGCVDLGNLEPLPAIFPKYEALIVLMDDGDRALARASWGFLTPNKSNKTGNWLNQLHNRCGVYYPGLHRG